MLDLEKKLTEENIYFEIYKHRAIYTNDDALIIKKEQGFSGTETKSLFLKGKDGTYFIFLTFTTKRTNFKKLKQVVGQKLSVVSPEDMEELTGQKPGAVSPFGYESNVPVIIDEELLEQEKLVFAPGHPDRTMVVLVKDLDRIIEGLGINRYVCPKEVT
jgi:Ala-tRNA(Pro) deacylase